MRRDLPDQSQTGCYAPVMLSETDVNAEAETSNEQGTSAGDTDDGNQDNRRCQATSVMSRISGVKRDRTLSSSSFGKTDLQLPTYGVDDVADSILVEVRKTPSSQIRVHTVRYTGWGKKVTRSW